MKAKLIFSFAVSAFGLLGFSAYALFPGMIPTATTFSPSVYKSAKQSFESTGKATQYLGRSCERSNDAYLCMMCNCMREAAGEPLEGKKLVGQVVKTRAQPGNPWPDDICGVIYEYKQFSWTIHQRDRRSLPRQMSQSMMECGVATDATINEPGNGMDHYHADYVSPGWARTCEKVTKIGAHIFYKNCGSKSPGRRPRAARAKR